MNKIFSILTIVLFSINLISQDLYIPRNIKQAYENKTRSSDGQPGEKYWQNTGDYTIAFKVNPTEKIVSGTEAIVYSNYSPDTLKTLVIRFVNNLNKPTSPRQGKVSEEFFAEGLTVNSIVVNGHRYEVNSKDWETVYELKLDMPLVPNSKNTVNIDWQYPLSPKSWREGIINENTFFCAYAYPRISVYDDYNGWDILPHMGYTEFYNDFNNYEVSVVVPKDYIVYATGTLTNPEEVLQLPILNKFIQSLSSDEVIHVATKEEIDNHKVTAQKPENIWKFTASHVPDFAFAISSSYIWDASSIQLKTKRVSVQATYNAGAADFEHYVEWEKYTIKWYSENWPGIDYPFPTMTAFQGFSNMEYPMMINDVSVPDNFSDAQMLVNHEIGHSYFPFYMGTNETRYAYMDEGWAVFLEYLIGEEQYGKELNDQMLTDYRVKRYILDPSTEEDQPIITLSSQLSGKAYRNNSYIKPAFAYLSLKDLLGDDVFKKALHHYMNTWNGKHPMPWDFFYSMNVGSEQDLNWFWNNWFFSNNYVDLKIKSTEIEGKNLIIEVENTGGFAIPFDLEITYEGGTHSNKHFSPEVWQNSKHFKIQAQVNKKIKTIKLDGGIYMDYTPDDNVISF